MLREKESPGALAGASEAKQLGNVVCLNTSLKAYGTATDKGFAVRYGSYAVDLTTHDRVGPEGRA